MKSAVISFTVDGAVVAEKLKDAMTGMGYEVQWMDKCSGDADYSDEPLGSWTRKQFKEKDALIFVGACGIAVRAIAPYIKSKTTDPAVLVVDDQGKYCIPILAGHIGGANALCNKLSTALSMTPVVTTSTDGHGVFAVDVFSAENGLQIMDLKAARQISARLLQGETITLRSEGGTITGAADPQVKVVEKADPPDVYIGIYRHPAWSKTLHLVPRALVAGIGCKKGITAEEIRLRVEAVLKEAQIFPESIKAVATIDRKREEEGLLTYCRENGLELLTFSAEELKSLPGEYTASDFVEEVMGVDNVCERSAAAAAGTDRIRVRKQSGGGVTVALAETEWSAAL